MGKKVKSIHGLNYAYRDPFPKTVALCETDICCIRVYPHPYSFRYTCLVSYCIH